MMNKLLLILIFLLAACGNTVTPPVRVITTTSYPSLPPMSKPLPANLMPYKYTLPNDANAYRCFDYNNFGIYLTNMTKLRELIKLYDGRIDEVNRQRIEWNKIDGRPDEVIEN